MAHITNWFDDFIINDIVPHMTKEKVIEADQCTNGAFSKIYGKQLMIQLDPEYTEIGPRVLHYPIPKHYDVYGYDKDRNKWPYYDLLFSFMDDFGNAVPHDGLNYAQEELRGYEWPEYDPKDESHETYTYILYTPFPH